MGEARDKGVDHEAVLEAVAALVQLEALLLLAGALDGRYTAAGGGGIWFGGGVLGLVGGAGEHLHHLFEGGGVGLDEGGGVGIGFVRSGDGGFGGGGGGVGRGGVEVEGGSIAAAGGAAIAVGGVCGRWVFSNFWRSC